MLIWSYIPPAIPKTVVILLSHVTNGETEKPLIVTPSVLPYWFYPAGPEIILWYQTAATVLFTKNIAIVE